MPPGSKCDHCNSYLSELDTALCTHPIVAFHVQALGLPGKQQKPRKQLGFFVRAENEIKNQITLVPEGVKEVRVSGERPVFVLEPPKGSARKRFHRSLYCVGFNLLSVVSPVEDLLGPDFDPVRKYVRAPSRNEIWPYCHTIWNPQPVELVELSILKANTPQVAIWFFNHVFVVDLFKTSGLREHLMSWAPDGVTWEEIL